MKISKRSCYTTLFAVLVLAQLYLPSFKLNILIQLVFLAGYLLAEKTTITRGVFRMAMLLLLLLGLGFIGTVVYSNNFFNVVKDLSHFIKPISGFLIAYLLFRKVNDFKLFVRTIVWIGVLSAIIHLLTVLLFSDLGSVAGLREFSKDNFIELFALLFLAYYKKFHSAELFPPGRMVKAFYALLLVSILLYLSRTMLIAAVILLLSVYGYTVINLKTLRRLALLLCIVGVGYAYLFTLKLDRTKGFESFLYKIQIAPSEIFEARIDREDHTDLWDHWRAYEAKRAIYLMNQNPGSYVYGMGHGSMVNLKFFAALTGSKHDRGLKYISELHNGYIYVLYKTGLIGIVVYMLFLLGLYLRIYANRGMANVFISGIGLIYLFTTLIITGIYNARDIIIFVLGALVAFSYSRPETANTETASDLEVPAL